MKREDSYSIEMREEELRLRRQAKKKMLHKKDKLLKSYKRIHIKCENAALKIQKYWKNNFLLKKRLHEILHEEERRIYNNALQTKKVKYEKIESWPNWLWQN